MKAQKPDRQRPSEMCAIGLDIGGTKIAGGLVDSHGSVLAKRMLPTRPERGGEPILHDAINLAGALLEDANHQHLRVAGIGIGLCELVDLRGNVISEHTIKWRGWPVAERFNGLAPAMIEADSRAAAFGEARCGAGKPFRSFYYVTVGTGIGGCWVVEGLPYAGANGCTGTLASSPSAVLCSDCGVVRQAVLEDIASGSALVARYNQKTNGAAASAEDVLLARAKGDSLAEWVVNTAVESLGAAVGLLVNVLDPEAVIIGGGLGSAPGAFWDGLNGVIRKYIWSDIHRGIPILQASLGGTSGMIGAALLALKKARVEQECAWR